jgi:hypothetical protein
LALGLLCIVPFTNAFAQAPTVSVISDVTLNAGTTQTVNVVAVGMAGSSITLTATLPSYATLNSPTSGTGTVVTTITLAPASGDVGSFAASVTATSGSETETEHFTITVNASDTNSPPVVVAPALENGNVGSNLTFTVTASDVDGDAITSLTATNMPSGATFTPNGTNTSGTFSWTPASGQAGEYDVTFTASNALSGSATTHIHVNHNPVLTAPATRTVTEGQTLAFTVTATDADGDHVTLTASGLPTGASVSDQGNNTLNFSWQPATGQAGTYTVTFTGTDGNGGTGTATTTITVLAAGQTGGATATVTLQGIVNTHSGKTCFSIRPDNNSFDVRNVQLSTITLQFNGQSISPISGSTHLQFDCEGEDTEHDSTDCNNDVARFLFDGGHPHGGEDDSCEECGDHEGCDGCEADTCNAVGIRTCFSTSALIALFGDTTLPEGLSGGTVQFTLQDGTVVTATFSGAHLVSHGKGHLNVKARPNPLNPRTVLTFTLSKPGHVDVSLYDLQGRLVRRLVNETRAAGPQSVVWDGTNSRSQHVSSGVYFFRIQAPEGREIQRVAVVK